jgi:type IV pilus assembly protein PilC
MADKNTKDLDLASFKDSYNLDVKERKPRVVLNIEEESEGMDLASLQMTGAKLAKPRGLFARINRYLLEHSAVKIKEKANFFHLLAVMINAGIPMIRALRSLSAQTSEKSRLKFVVNDLADLIEGGSSLSKSLKLQKEVFTEAEIGMIESGEASGQLSKVLANLAADTEKSFLVRSKIKGAMTYPLIVLAILILVVVGMMLFVVPQLSELFEANGKDLPLITKVVVAISDFFVNYGYGLLLIVLLIFLAFYFGRRLAAGRMFLDQMKLKLPIFGDLLQKGYLARFARSLGNLLDSNVTIVRSLEITANSIGNEVYRKRLLLAQEDISQGIPLAENLAENPLFPPMLINMIEVGEQTAQLDQIMVNVAKFYEEEVDTAVAGITKVIEPVILVMIGITVGAVVAAIMLPIVQLTDLAGV